MNAIRAFLAALRKPLGELAIWTNYANAELAVTMAQRALVRAQEDLQLAIAARDDAYALVRALEELPRPIPSFLLKKDDNGEA